MPEIINNYLSPTNFTISIEKLPNVEFFTQKLTIPDVTATATSLGTPLANMYEYGDRIEYGELTTTMIIDENMNNYKEILNWIEGYASPESSNQNKNFAQIRGHESDIIATITNSHKNPNIRFVFKNCFPTSLGGVSLDVNVQDVAYATTAVTWRYDTFTMEQL
jgi:hypothetical protein